jgi:hypothetical protein
VKWIVAALFPLTLTGCTSLTDVDVGAGDIPALLVYAEYYGLPQGEWVSDGALRWEVDSTDVTIRTDPLRTTVSAIQEVRFLSSSDSALAKQRIGDYTDAVDGMALQVLELVIEDPDTEEPLDARITCRVSIDGKMLGPSGWKGRISLSDTRKNQVLSAVQKEQPVSLPVGVDLAVPPGDGDVLPTQARVRMTIQPILVVQALKAL